MSIFGTKETTIRTNRPISCRIFSTQKTEQLMFYSGMSPNVRERTCNESGMSPNVRVRTCNDSGMSPNVR